MARDHARIWVSVWNDPDFTALTTLEQAVYWMLISSEDLSYCGVLDNVAERFTGLAADLTKRKFTAAVATLRQKAFLVVDDRTAEILVRAYIRRDQILRLPNVSKAMVRALRKVHSADLRQAVTAELTRIRRDDPEAKGWRGVEDESPYLFSEVCGMASQNGSGNPSGKDAANA